MISKYKKKTLKNKRLNLDTPVFPVINLHCILTKNNFHVSVCNPITNGVLRNFTSGQKFKSRQKTTTFAIKSIANDITSLLENYSTKEINFLFNGFNKLSEELCISLSKQFTVLSLREVSPVVFNGVRKPKQRRP